MGFMVLGPLLAGGPTDAEPFPADPDRRPQEILYKSGVHPDQPANTVSRAKFELIWKHSVLLLQRGFKTGSILTVDPADAQRLGEPWTRRYIYGQAKCGECGSKTSVYGECRTAEQTRRGRGG